MLLMPSRPPRHNPFGAPIAAADAERKRKAAIDARRGNSAGRGYDHIWRKIRLAKLSAEPLCRRCREAGRVTAAVEVDHIDGNSRNNADVNLRPLCKPCHSSRTARDQGFAVR